MSLEKHRTFCSIAVKSQNVSRVFICKKHKSNVKKQHKNHDIVYMHYLVYLIHFLAELHLYC